MGSIFEIIFNFIVEAIKLILYIIIWNVIFFYIGVAVLKILTYGKYPVGKQFEKHVNILSGVGLNTIFLLWASIATYNYSENIYFLVVGAVVAAIQASLIIIKYYSQFRNNYVL